MGLSAGKVPLAKDDLHTMICIGERRFDPHIEISYETGSELKLRMKKVSRT